MVLAGYFNDYKEAITKHPKINESHKKFYIIWVELFLKYLGEDSPAEDKLPEVEMLTYFYQVPT